MKPFCAAVDWGTSRFRLWLLAEDGTVLNQISTNDGLQVSAEQGFSKVLEAHLTALGCPETLPVIICGMAGSRTGWKEAYYLDAPVNLNDIINNAVSISDSAHDIRILPGIAQRDSQKPDVMRGEETQLLGMLASKSLDSLSENQIICMPGTHSKWVTLNGSKLTHFTTFMTGELYALLSNNSVLKLSMGDNAQPHQSNKIFVEHVLRAIEQPMDISAQLFSIRASYLLGFEAGLAGSAALSGSLIGLELAGAFSRHGKPTEMTLMASGSLGALYETALKACDVEIKQCDAEKSGMNGMLQAARALWGSTLQAEKRKA